MSRKPPRLTADFGDDRTLYPDEVPDGEDAVNPVDSLVPFKLAERERYDALGVLAEGGMGVIEWVLDRRLGRRLVRKLAHEGRPDLESRLAREAWVIAQLDHPSIIQVLDAGILPSGRGFYTMPFVEGRPLSDCLADAPEAEDRRRFLRNLRTACEAVGYAHQEGFVHRDLKPDNLMVGSFGDTRVMDWGLARPVSGPTGDRWRAHFPKDQVGLTHVGTILGTPAYMAPEQARGEVAEPTADVWSLGVILYEVMTGEPLFDGADAREILAAVVQGADAALVRARPSLPGPLHAVLARALAHDPQERFASAKELADELTRWLEGQVVVSHRYTPAERVGTFVVRWRVPVLAAGVTAAFGVLGMGAFALSAQRESRMARESQREAELAQLYSEFARRKGERYLKGALVAQSRAAVRRNDRVTGEVLAAEALKIGEDPVAMGVLLTWSGQPPPEQRYQGSLEELPAYRTLSPDGHWLATADDETVQLWSTEPLEQQWSQPASSLLSLSVDNKGSVVVRGSHETLLIKASGAAEAFERGRAGRILRNPYDGLLYDYSSELRLVRRPSEAQADSPVVTDCAQTVAFTPQGFWAGCGRGLVHKTGDLLTERRLPDSLLNDSPSVVSLAAGSLFVGTIHSRVARLDPETLASSWVRSFEHAEVRALRHSPHSDHIVALFSDGAVELLDPTTGETLLTLPQASQVEFVGLDASGVLTLLSPSSVERLQLDPGLRSRIWSTPSGVTDLEFAPGGEALVAGSGPQALVFDWPSGVQQDGRVFDNVVKNVDFAPDGALVVAAVRPDDGAPSAVVKQVGPGAWEPYGAPGPPGLRRMVMLGDDMVVAGWSPTGPRHIPGEKGQTQWSIADAAGRAGALANTPDASRAIWSGPSGLWVMDAGDTAPRLIPEIPFAWKLSTDQTGSIALLDTVDSCLLVELETGTVRWKQPRPTTKPTAVAVGPDGRFGATGLRGGRVLLRDLETGTVVAELDAHTEKVQGVAFSEDGTTLVTGGWDNRIRVWDLAPLRTPLDDQLAAIEARWDITPGAILRGLP